VIHAQRGTVHPSDREFRATFLATPPAGVLRVNFTSEIRACCCGANRRTNFEREAPAFTTSLSGSVTILRRAGRRPMPASGLGIRVPVRNRSTGLR
jgi:hypothetical protein